MRKKVCYIALLLPLWLACRREAEEVIPAAILSVPAGFPALPATPDNPLSPDGIALGRQLFYDTRLSGNNQLSCATCHRPELAFSDGEALSRAGVSGKRLSRHAPTLMNLAWAVNGLFWDGGATNLESQAFGPLTHPDEMGQDLETLVQELKAVPAYVSLFNKVFQRDIRATDVVKALAQFQRTLISGNSRYDQYLRGTATLNVQEQQGLQLVARHCNRCHAGALFTDQQYHNNGLDRDFTNTAEEGLFQGRYRVTYAAADLGKYRTPTLRNLVYTAPYMHDGRLPDLTAVLDHYSDGIQPGITTDAQLSGGLHLDKQEKAAILAFLHTLTDEQFITRRELGAPIPW
ncbi:cytochrome-c peroxidase [Chitinophaga nivalis]|uniref:C-type cytochrome n=1 Tax=Chitinophaga nivalis TaxID=2991709 RepID=A0ABT3IJ77_9BACT|nr:cytochrome c peroxidase [Chitinophaga nivalis]MCW3466307.1 c-type cytochrome [Chitinophaga nivalis]MCW3484002.1 c-type cytochrome [Chitinophaga nivalis]